MFFDKEVDVTRSNKYLSEEELYKMAKKRVKIKKEFATHAGSYLMVNAGLLGISTIISPFRILFALSAFGWGIGLGCHYISMVTTLKFDLKDSAIQREMDHLARNFNKDKNNP